MIALASFYETLLTRPREVHPLLLGHNPGEQNAAMLGGLALAWINYFRVTQDYPLLLEKGLGVVLKAADTTNDKTVFDPWLKRLFLHLKRISRFETVVEAYALSKFVLDRIESTPNGPLQGYALDQLLPETPWQQRAFCSLGLKLNDDELAFAPIRPEAGGRYQLSLVYRGSRLQITAKPDSLHFLLTEGAAQPVSIYHLDYLLEDELVIDYL